MDAVPFWSVTPVRARVGPGSQAQLDRLDRIEEEQITGSRHEATCLSSCIQPVSGSEGAFF